MRSLGNAGATPPWVPEFAIEDADSGEGLGVNAQLSIAMPART
jgi:hypothetical protein